MCKEVEGEEDQDGGWGGGNISAEKWTKWGQESWGNQGVGEEEFQQETGEHAKVLRPVQRKIKVSRQRTGWVSMIGDKPEERKAWDN